MKRLVTLLTLASALVVSLGAFASAAEFLPATPMLIHQPKCPKALTK